MTAEAGPSKTFRLNDRAVPFRDGDTVIRAAWREGIEIPHYCWHPGLSVAANCRMCLVEIRSGRQMAMPVVERDEKTGGYRQATKPKLHPACQTPAAEGMEVWSESPEVLKTQAAVQEFLLLNHPVDCPICDQAGECRLQDYWHEHQQRLKRKLSEPVHKPKGVRFGDTIVYDAERCIMCTRCVRFCDEVAGDHVLDMRERGNRNEIVLAQGRQLDHKYTLMTEHVCPVGALTSRDFRFKARVWFLRSASSVCPGCATGCTMHADYDPRTQKVFRLRPRDNEAVNNYWMCDDGMMTYRRLEESRVVSASVCDDGTPREASIDEALARAADLLRGVAAPQLAVLYSADHSTEDNAALHQVAMQLGIELAFLAGRTGWQGDEVLRSDDNNANRAGALQAAQAKFLSAESDLIEAIEAGDVTALIALGSVSGLSEMGAAALQKIKLVTLASAESPYTNHADVVLPASLWLETAGSFRNRKGLDQSFEAAVQPLGEGEPAWMLLAALLQASGYAPAWRSLDELRLVQAPAEASTLAAKSSGQVSRASA